MFGRGRIFGRARRRDVSPILVEANRRQETGDFAGAADLYEQVANLRGGRRPRQAAQLLAAAGRARLLARQEAAAQPLFQRALQLLADEGRWLSYHHQSQRILDGLREQGYPQQADALLVWMNGQRLPAKVQAQINTPPQPAPARRPRLPLKCTGCGAPVDPRDVEWVDDATAECSYCGGMLRGEG